MRLRSRAGTLALGGLLCASMLSSATQPLMAASHESTSAITAATLVGTWTLTAADDLQPDGARVHAYGSDPRGILVFAADGRYTLQIFRENRAKFASGDKRQGTLDEYKEASLGMSCHFGHYSVDQMKGTLTFQIERASFPNWDGATQTRPFTLKGDDLEWHVPATPDGKIPVSAWRRLR
jgi:Lipocalin-like domain